MLSFQVSSYCCLSLRGTGEIWGNAALGRYRWEVSWSYRPLITTLKCRCNTHRFHTTNTALVQGLKLPAWKAGDHWFVPRSAIQVSKKHNVSSLLTRRVGSLRDWEIACSASDRHSSNFETCIWGVWKTVSSHLFHHPQKVILAQFMCTKWPITPIIHSIIHSSIYSFSDWMNIHEWINEGKEWMYEWVNEWKNECMNEWNNYRMNKWINEWMNEWMNEWIK